MSKMKSTTVSADDNKVIADVNNNRRIAASQEFFGVHVDTYNLSDMIRQIKEAGRVLTPLVFSRGKNGFLKLLQGYRRWLAVQAILRDPNTSAELRKALEKLPALVYEDLSETEEWEKLNDHGDRLDTANAELVLAVFDDYDNNRSEAQIIRQRLYSLAKFTDNEAKLRNLPAEDGPARKKFMTNWMHGTVGNYLLGVARLGDRYRKALYLTELWGDGKLKEENDPRPEFKMSRKRFDDITAAIEQDQKAETWDEVKKTGPVLEGVIAKFITEDKTGKKERASSNRPKEADLKSRRDSTRSTIGKMAYSVAIGETVEGFRVKDDETARMEMIADLIGKNLDSIGDPRLKDTLTRVLHSHPVDFEKFLIENSIVQTELADGPDKTVEQQQASEIA